MHVFFLDIWGSLQHKQCHSWTHPTCLGKQYRRYVFSPLDYVHVLRLINLIFVCIRPESPCAQRNSGDASLDRSNIKSKLRINQGISDVRLDITEN